MSTVLVTPAAEDPITLAEAKAHLRVTHSDDDTYITALIKTATGMAETICNRKFITQTWKYFFNDWGNCRCFELPFPPVNSVTHVKYKASSDGTLTTLSTDDYQVDKNGFPARICMGVNTASYPTLQLNAVDRIEVQFICGYGAASAVPNEIKQAIMILIAQWYEHREPVSLGIEGKIVPMSAEYLLYPYRCFFFPK